MTPTKTQTKTDDIYVTFRKLLRRSQAIEVMYRDRSDFLVLSSLREGKPVYVSRSFKWNGREWGRGEQFTCPMGDLQRLSAIMEKGGRILITEQEQKDREEWTRIKPVVDALRPAIDTARDKRAEANAASMAAVEAERAAQFAKGHAADTAQWADTAERKAGELLGQFDLTGIEI
jgi:hypothetical protein